MPKDSRPPLRFGIGELAGSLGDFGTILPLSLALAATGALGIGPVLLFLGIWFIVTGYYYRYPVPVEPMKAIAVIAVAAGMSGGEIAAAGLILGGIFLIFGCTNILEIIERYIPLPVVRGIQLGLALLLLRTAAGYILPDPGFFLLGALIIIAGFLVATHFRVPDLSSIAVIAVAIVAGIIIQGFPPISTLSLTLIAVPSWSEIIASLADLVLPQAILTITNAILATSLLAKDLFSADIRPKKLSLTIGLMNLTSIPFGGMPMCHGAGGMAGQYRFGARTGGANIYAGIILIGAALLFASTAWLGLISPGFYAALLIFVAIELARHGVKTSSYLVTITTAVLSLVASMTVAFIAGMCLAYGIPYFMKQIGEKNR
ncbi:MAG TPA: putative sulfate/molybdate transporter [Methanoregulaceae archaeon]|nr:putative sulfate/molybdate transporter [Methanoregulaceae archaeon]HPX72833.1 putative sulfate/molybdate transporter [Methanoregulaceae archaeon]